MSDVDPAGAGSVPARIEFRVAGIARRGDALLTFWVPGHGDYRALPGGHIDPGEDARRALEREMSEELGVHARVDRFRFVIENSFRQPDGPHQEICLYFDMELPEGELVTREDHLAVEWLPKERWGELRPAILAELITDGRGHHAVQD